MQTLAEKDRTLHISAQSLFIPLRLFSGTRRHFIHSDTLCPSFFAGIYLLRRKRSLPVFIGIISGAVTRSLTDGFYVLGTALVFLLFYRLMDGIIENGRRHIPIYVFLSIFIIRTLDYIVAFQDLTLYYLLLTLVEAGLAFVLAHIFLLSLPLLFNRWKKQSLKTEEIICLVIMLGSVITGMMDLVFMDLSAAHIFSRYLVALFALAAGASVGSSVGVVIGLIFGLAEIESFNQLSLLAFSGLVGGLLKEGKKIGVSGGLLLATLLIGMYGTSVDGLVLTIYESLLAGLILFLTPAAFVGRIAASIPGTNEYYSEQQSYLRKVRDMTIQRVDQFASIFRALSVSFSKNTQTIDPDSEMDSFLSRIAERTCHQCNLKELCWRNHFNTTYERMVQVITDLREKGEVRIGTERELKLHCFRYEKVIQAIKNELPYWESRQKLKRRVRESQQLVADQLWGVADVMDNFAKELQKERENLEKQEEQLLQALVNFGIDVEQVEIFSLKEGNVDIEMKIPFCEGLGQCEKLIAPLLTDILGETIIVSREMCGKRPGDYCRAVFRSTHSFAVETGVVFAAKDGGFISGDSHTLMEIGAGKFALAISDGMGNGIRAHHESKETIHLLKKILQSGIDEEIAIKSVNSILALRTTEEIYSTLDLAIIDLKNLQAKFIKVGSMPSYIKRGNKVIKIQTGNLPIGILQDFEVEIVREQLKPGDLLIMMSDGLMEGKQMPDSGDAWMRKRIAEIETDHPQEVADLILEDCIRSRGGEIADDMTVLVAKIVRNMPKWKTIPAISLRKMA